MSFPRTTLLSLWIIALSGCASAPPEASGRTAPTTVLKANTSYGGRLMPDAAGSQIVYTRGDRRSRNDVIEFDSILLRWANSDELSIARLDRSLVWLVDHNKENYMECPLSGCEASSIWDEHREENYEDEECATELVSNDLTVTPTGDRRLFDNMEASEYVVNWEVEFEDPDGRSDTSLVKFTLWTTEPTASMSDAWAVHREFQESYLRKGGNDPLLRLLGRQGYMALAAFSGDVEKTDAEQYNSVARKLADIPGYPLSIELEWFREKETCPDNTVAKNDDSSSEKDIMGIVGERLGKFLRKKREEFLFGPESDPLVRYIYEVKSVEEEMIRNSAFEVPRGYRLADRQ